MDDDAVFIDLERELREICILIKNKGRVMLQDFELTPPQFEALQLLVCEGEQTLGELSSKMYLACSTITDLLDRMEKTDLVKRVKDSKDRRITRVIVLPKGHQVIESVLAARCSFLKEALAEADSETLMLLKTHVIQLNQLMTKEK